MSRFSPPTGKIYFNELHLRYKYATYETGTIVHDADWAIIFDHSTASQLQFMTFGFNAVHATGILFYLTFEVVDNQVATEAVTGIASEWSINGGTTPFAINNGSVNYTSNAGTSLMKGDATMDFSVNIDDYWRILYHVNGNLLTGQALINADVNKDGRVDELDAADILGYLGLAAGIILPECPVYTIEMQPFGNHHVQIRQVLLERTRARIIPVDEEADGKRSSVRTTGQLMRLGLKELLLIALTLARQLGLGFAQGTFAV